MARPNGPVGESRGLHLLSALASAVLLLPIVSATADAQYFYQLTNARVYRVNPPTPSPWSHKYGYGGLAFRPIEGDPNGQILMCWEQHAPAIYDGLWGELTEMKVPFDSAPSAQAQNDAMLLNQVYDWGWCYNLDYESDDRVLVHARADYGAGGLVLPSETARAAKTGVGRVIRTDGLITGFETTHPFGVSAYTLHIDLRMRGAFAGMRQIGGQTYDTTAMINWGTDDSALYLVDITTGEVIDAEPNSATPHAPGHPYIGFTGNTGVTNILSPIVTGTTHVVGLDVVGDTAFFLITTAEDTAQPYLTLFQVDLLGKRVVGTADLRQLFGSSRGVRPSAYSWGFDVTATGSDTVRILMADPVDTTFTTLTAIDAVRVPEGSAAIAADAVYTDPGASNSTDGSGTNGDSSNGNGSSTQPSATGDTNGQQAVIWVCPGFGIAIPAFVVFFGVWISRRRG